MSARIGTEATATVSAGSRAKFALGRDQSDHRRDNQPVTRGELIQAAEYSNACWIDADLLLAFAQRGSDHVGIGRIDPAAGKSNLTFVRAQMICALGQHQIVVILPFLDRDQHRRWFVTVARDDFGLRDLSAQAILFASIAAKLLTVG